MKTCQTCGNLIADDANFCSRCGHSQTLYASPVASGGQAKKTCPWCNGRGTVADMITGQEIRCRVCKGQTYNTFGGTAQRCTRCGGTGVESKKSLVMNARRPCNVCGGKGWLGD
jgi:hypothetical protein